MPAVSGMIALSWSFGGRATEDNRLPYLSDTAQSVVVIGAGLCDGRSGTRPGEPDRRDPRLETQLARGNVFAGTPDQVFQQLKNFWEYSGGFGHLLMMGQAGFMTYDETIRSMTLFTQDVYPRLKELTASYDAGAMKELRSSRPDVEQFDVGLLASEFVR